ncbi:MAG: ribonuclease HI [Candidatus Pacebacteria bacterium CG10_big_fil_rev_8_21_14_0_10_56_10]|nr:MAG: ribonuclease HI [Candidatus Pacebacteria bacterium CG10_big_fil_rev_8_21_14_0_10_56_10]
MPISSSQPVRVYTDGGCDPNPGPGGYAAAFLYPDGKQRQLAGGSRDSTNNRMELTAAIKALQALDGPSRVELYTDSQYLQQGITQWLPKWLQNNWRTANRKPVKNQDLWKQLWQESQRHHVEWKWVRAHAGDHYNELVDSLVAVAREQAGG